MANVWTQFKELLPSKLQYTGQVTTVHADGTSTVTLLGGSTVRVIGDLVSSGNHVLIEGDRILMEVPNLTSYEQAVG